MRTAISPRFAIRTLRTAASLGGMIGAMSQPVTSTAPIDEVKPSGQPRAGVIVIQEAFGVNDHIKDVCRRFADVGYHAVAPHLFHRSGDPVISYDDVQSVFPHFQAL